MFTSYVITELYSILAHLVTIKHKSDPKVLFQHTLCDGDYLVLTVCCCSYTREA